MTTALAAAPTAATPYSAPAPPAAGAPDRLLLRKLVLAGELLAIGERAAAHAMICHVIDVAEAGHSLPAALYTTALRIREQTAG